MEYFPPNSLDERPELHASKDQWYASHLLAMEELPLYPPSPDQPPVYRLLYLPTFRRPTVVRLSESDSSWRIVCKRSDGHGGYSPGRLIGSISRELSRAETKRIARLLDRGRFWEMPSFDTVFGADGSRVVIEGARTGNYHIVDRWSPHGTPYAELAEFLLSLCRGVDEPAPKPPKDHRSFAELAERFRPRAEEG